MVGEKDVKLVLLHLSAELLKLSLTARLLILIYPYLCTNATKC